MAKLPITPSSLAAAPLPTSPLTLLLRFTIMVQQQADNGCLILREGLVIAYTEHAQKVEILWTRVGVGFKKLRGTESREQQSGDDEGQGRGLNENSVRNAYLNLNKERSFPILHTS